MAPNLSLSNSGSPQSVGRLTRSSGLPHARCFPLSGARFEQLFRFGLFRCRTSYALTSCSPQHYHTQDPNITPPMFSFEFGVDDNDADRPHLTSSVITSPSSPHSRRCVPLYLLCEDVSLPICQFVARRRCVQCRDNSVHNQTN